MNREFPALGSPQYVSLLRRMHGMLETDELQYVDDFTIMVNAVFDRCSISKRALQGHNGYDAATVESWLRGQIPEKSSWPFILKRVLRALKEHIESYEETGRAPEYPEISDKPAPAPTRPTGNVVSLFKARKSAPKR